MKLVDAIAKGAPQSDPLEAPGPLQWVGPISGRPFRRS